MDAENGGALEALAAKVNELGKLCARLSQENAEFRRRLSTAPVTASPAGGRPLEAQVSRRVMGRALGVAAAGAVGSAALVGLGARPAEAANSNAILAGELNAAESITELKYDGQSGVKLVALFSDANIGPGSSAFTAALAGWAGAGPSLGKGGVANGVYGFTDNGDGNGVVGVNHGDAAGSLAGAGVLGRTEIAGGTGVIADAGGVANGTGLSASGATAINAQSFAAGGVGVNASGGSIGVSATGGAVGVSAQTQSGGTAVAASGGDFGVSASGNAAGIKAQGPTAVQAVGTTNGVNASGATAVLAAGTATGVTATGATAVLATGTMQGIKAHGTNRGGIFSGNAAHVHFTPGPLSTHPINGEQGDLYADKTGRLWFCKKGGNKATWHQIA
jgi:hypothetical protein